MILFTSQRQDDSLCWLACLCWESSCFQFLLARQDARKGRPSPAKLQQTQYSFHFQTTILLLPFELSLNVSKPELYDTTLYLQS